LAWLSRRALTRAEVQARLQRHGFPDVESVLDRLTAEEWLSDRAVADIEYRRACRHRYGPERLRARLHARGVDPAVARAVMGELSSEDVRERAREALLGVISKQGIPDDEKGRLRLVRRLMRRGFPGAVIARALDSLQANTLGGEEDHDG